MKFDKLIEDFNIFPQSQNANQSGPDAGITTGSFTNAFPSRINTLTGNILPDEVTITLNKKIAYKLLKQLPKERQSKSH